MLIYSKINKKKHCQVSRKWEKKRGKCQESGRNKSQLSRKWEKKRGKCQESGKNNVKYQKNGKKMKKFMIFWGF